MSRLHQLRDQILESLRCQFAAKVSQIRLQWDGLYDAGDPEVDRFLKDLANNIAQGLVVDEDDDHCPNCGTGPLAETESDDMGRCQACANESTFGYEGDSDATLGLKKGIQKP